MPNSTLPTELVSLIHHVELNKAGWLDSALKRFVTAAIWMSGRTVTLAEISADLKDKFSIPLDTMSIKRHTDALCSAGILFPLPDGSLKLSETGLRNLTEEFEAAKAIERRVQSKFAAALKSHCQPLEPVETWQRFSEFFLIPFVREMGARTYELLTTSARHVDKSASFQQFLQRYPEPLRANLRDAILAFLDPEDTAVRTYLLRHLNAFFLIEASNLANETIDGVAGLAKLRPSFSILLDTNLLFSILNLHDSPGNDAAAALGKLVKSLPASIGVKLYVSPMTMDEAKRVLNWYRDALHDVRLTPNVADVLRRGQLSGITMKFAQECAKAGRSLNAEDYFRPYIEDLLTVLRSRGIELYNEPMEKIRSSQEVIDDLNDGLEFERRRFGERAKSYESMLHDVALWHFARTKRPTRVESPMEAKFWIGTIDFRLLGFDAYKRREVGALPVCIHPAALVQMLQFWLPRSREFEQAIVSSIKYPFLFYEYDLEAERTTIRIIEALGRFEGVGDLSRETVTRVLVSQALRQRLQIEKDVLAQEALVRDALVLAAAEREKDLAKAKEEIERLRSDVSAGSQMIERLEEKASTKGMALEEKEKSLEKEAQVRAQLAERIRELEGQIESESTKERLRRERVRFVWWSSAVLVLAGAMGVAGTFWLALAGHSQGWSRWTFWAVTVCVWAGLGLLWERFLDVYGRRLVGVCEWSAFEKFQQLKVRVYSAIGTVFLAALGKIVADLFSARWR